MVQYRKGQRSSDVIDRRSKSGSEGRAENRRNNRTASPRARRVSAPARAAYQASRKPGGRGK